MRSDKNGSGRLAAEDRQRDQDRQPEVHEERGGGPSPEGGEERRRPEVTQLSFAEVMQCIQEGREIPGVKKLDITPSNQNPTPSQMERIHKPWERDLSPNGCWASTSVDPHDKHVSGETSR
uniref:Peroxisomal membrane protein PEX14-like KPWE domain-containing protein n=1 Tax=Cynoglossus semilaevis TaxID=244447 RepID=A0A3P8X5X5_CYNSE